MHQIELRNKDLQHKQAYFHLYLHEKVSEIEPLDSNQTYLGTLNLTLFDALLSIQNDFFDTVSTNEMNGEVLIRVAIPENVKDIDVQEYMDYQALNYALVIHKLLPNNEYKTIQLNAFRKGAYDREFLSKFSFNGLLGLKKSNYDNKKILEHRLL